MSLKLKTISVNLAQISKNNGIGKCRDKERRAMTLSLRTT